MARPPLAIDPVGMALRLVILVAELAIINAAGVYARLVAAHVGERGAVTATIETQDAM